MGKIKIGTRTSALAMKQTQMVMDAIKQYYPETDFEIIPMQTKGDKILDKPLVEFGGKGAFVTELEEAMLRGKIDIAVHSAKDMPMELERGLGIVMTLARADVRDVLITRKDNKSGVSLVGTSSLRRELQIKNLMSVECTSLRGNVPTRVQKLRDGMYDGIILAAAGLKRLGLMDDDGLTYRILSTEEMIPAGGQGVIAVEGRQSDSLNELFSACSDVTAYQELETEREVLRLLGAGCHEPIGTISEIKGQYINIKLFLERDGKQFFNEVQGNVADRINLAKRLVREI